MINVLCTQCHTVHPKSALIRLKIPHPRKLPNFVLDQCPECGMLHCFVRACDTPGCTTKASRILETPGTAVCTMHDPEPLNLPDSPYGESPDTQIYVFLLAYRRNAMSSQELDEFLCSFKFILLPRT